MTAVVPSPLPGTPETPGTLRGHANFRRLWSAQAVSAIGSRVTRVALPIIAVQTLGEPESIVALLTALQIAPGVLLALFAGGVVDRGNKRRILIGADLCRAGLVALLTLAWAFGALSMWHVIAVGASVGAASAMFQITDVAFLPALIGKPQLAEGNSKLEATEAIAEITGPAGAGVLIAALGAPLAVVVDAASYLWSAVMLGRIRETAHAPAPAPDPQPEPEPIGLAAAHAVVAPAHKGDLLIGMRAVFGDPHVRPILAAHMVWAISGGFFLALYTMFCLRVLGLTETELGIIIAMGGIGSLAGALLARSLARAIGLGPALITSAALSLSAQLLMPLAHGSHTTVLVMLGAHQLISDAFSVAFIIHAVTIRQTVLPRGILGRANAAVHVCTSGMLPVAALVAGAIGELASVRTAVWVGVLIGLVAPLMMLPIRGLRVMPAAAPDEHAMNRATSGG